MKNLSIKWKITLWYSVALIIIVAITFSVIMKVSSEVLQKTIRDNLITTVEHNIDEVEFFGTVEDIIRSNDVDDYLPYKNGYIEVDDDFLDEVNQVYTTLYTSDGAFMYGENPIAEHASSNEFRDSQLQRIEVDGTLYYIFDRRLVRDGLDGLWLRGVVSEKQGSAQMDNISRTSLVFLPSFLLIAIIGGFLIASKILKPIRRITDSAAEIREGGDLKKRIDIGEGSDDLHQLANSFNQMFDRLEDAFQTERQFTSDASHELRTPMAVIMAQCELALEEECDKEEYIEALELIHRQGGKMSKLIDDMLNFTRLELKAERYTKEPINLSELVHGLASDMALISDRGIRLNTDIEEGISYIGNTELLTRLLTNLVNNAYRYGREDGSILVSLKRDNDGRILMSVKDDGIGISRDEQTKVFNRFYQSDSARSTGGTGLGLAMVQEIAKFHGGEIHLQSEIGVGSTFTLIL